MRRFMVMVDGSLRTEDLGELVVGNVFYEMDYSICKSVVKTTPVVSDDLEGGLRVEFEADVYYLNDKTLTFSEEPTKINYLSQANFAHYGGKFYSQLYVWDREGQCEVSLAQAAEILSIDNSI